MRVNNFYILLICCALCKLRINWEKYFKESNSNFYVQGVYIRISELSEYYIY